MKIPPKRHSLKLASPNDADLTVLVVLIIETFSWISSVCAFFVTGRDVPNIFTTYRAFSEQILYCNICLLGLSIRMAIQFGLLIRIRIEFNLDSTNSSVFICSRIPR